MLEIVLAYGQLSISSGEAHNYLENGATLWRFRILLCNLTSACRFIGFTWQTLNKRTHTHTKLVCKHLHNRMGYILLILTVFFFSTFE